MLMTYGLTLISAVFQYYLEAFRYNCARRPDFLIHGILKFRLGSTAVDCEPTKDLNLLKIYTILLF